MFLIILIRHGYFHMEQLLCINVHIYYVAIAYFKFDAHSHRCNSLWMKYFHSMCYMFLRHNFSMDSPTNNDV